METEDLINYVKAEIKRRQEEMQRIEAEIDKLKGILYKLELVKVLEGNRKKNE